MTATIETLFAQIEFELAVEKLKQGIKQGFVKQDKEVSETMSELSEDYWPGVKMIVEEF